MAGRIQALSLYKSLLRAHEKFLPQEMRQLGDAYVKSEFRLHKSVTKPEQLQQFFKEWNGYLAHIEQTGRERQLKSAGLTDAGNRGKSNNNNVNFGRDAPAHIELNEEQQSQLQKLREEATNAKKTT
mmetsp:Transcript_7819/g.16736  ORF Transcript_7819/g.16736 Transcript_7819/m.16736 type:complete len:127 (-) Transcript_7819:3047-3427(-)|eukprot:CAMPEP_0171372946 /NCGR_PEP_ID=MMETSP0879-20121228/11397_1 /TAXON_ID=67004 /ORGANISM="Thalassiosira weissflogii, Strain CCMP1336" /LENGTH=126 /DNA_ID=CAMNT_0011881885 /DNA_START=44 /DNA_END=424 /DNA_ORIENTATION=+